MFGYIYKIYCKNPEIKEHYIGSTINYKRRMRQHKYSSNHIFNNQTNLYDFIRNNGSINNFQSEILLKVMVNEKKDLYEIEKQFIKNDNNLLNKYIPNRNQKEYYFDNYDILKEKRKMKYKKNRDEILHKKSSIMVTCECGSILTKNHIHRHYKTIKHCKYINNINSQPTQILD